MVRIGKNVTISSTNIFVGEDSLFVKWLEIRPMKDTESAPNVTIISNTEFNIYGDSADLADLQTRAENRGYVFTVNGDAPPEVLSPQDPTPTPDEVTALAEMKQAFENARIAEQDRIWALVEAEYDLIKTTAEPFRRFTDIKHLRGL